MKRLFTFVRTLTLTFAVLAAGHGALKAQDAEAFVRQLNEKYASIETLRASFDQSLHSPFAGGESEMSGMITLQGNQYRIETPQQTIVTDGETTWVYSPIEEQLIISRYEEDETTFSPGQFLAGLPDQFSASDGGAENIRGMPHRVLNLLSTDPHAFLQDVRLWVRERDLIVTRMRIVDINETTMYFELRDIELNPDVSAEVFQFVAPPDTEIIDLR